MNYNISLEKILEGNKLVILEGDTELDYSMRRLVSCVKKESDTEVIVLCDIYYKPQQLNILKDTEPFVLAFCTTGLEESSIEDLYYFMKKINAIPSVVIEYTYNENISEFCKKENIPHLLMLGEVFGIDTVLHTAKGE